MENLTFNKICKTGGSDQETVLYDFESGAILLSKLSIWELSIHFSLLFIVVNAIGLLSN
jgi:hypothetical protein